MIYANFIKNEILLLKNNEPALTTAFKFVEALRCSAATFLDLTTNTSGLKLAISCLNYSLLSLSLYTT